MSNIEKAVNEVLAIPAIQDAIDAANTAAANAQGAADAQKATSSLIASYIDPTSFSGDLISVTSAGVVTVKTHTRVYGDSVLNPSRSVTGSTFTVSGVSSGDIIRISYSDPTRTGGAVTYTTTVDPAAPVPQGGSNHSVGAVSVPAAGSNSGQYINPPGYIDEQLL
jgi:hypothetical protein